ncbi:MAG: CopG family transcriptional regulator [Gammaproteobacteria bacterium]|nr:CopG family transcriptional regulator [Gammaproteobacteria bacterium]MCY4183011.1 CopG family transcriptional regulator [Gammaproteobacteria bacterium]MCY4183013.1 CopG family transcriptional regulator [Gammaproteobacteria bacterium]MCY4269542.1 CopG family transcriptional regulator [Gammaproteobacteria bacterium]MCY4269544.1 CopG family transcriptional regulator [Gammaproteobacteria bacterium]
MVRIKLPREIESDLALLSALTGNSVEFHIRQAILEYLDELEDRVANSRWLEAAIAEESAEYKTEDGDPKPKPGGG